MVLTICRSKSHDLHYFRNPQAITGDLTRRRRSSAKDTMRRCSESCVRPGWALVFRVRRNAATASGAPFAGDRISPPGHPRRIHARSSSCWMMPANRSDCPVGLGAEPGRTRSGCKLTLRGFRVQRVRHRSAADSRGGARGTLGRSRKPMSARSASRIQWPKRGCCRCSARRRACGIFIYRSSARTRHAGNGIRWIATSTSRCTSSRPCSVLVKDKLQHRCVADSPGRYLERSGVTKKINRSRHIRRGLSAPSSSSSSARPVARGRHCSHKTRRAPAAANHLIWEMRGGAWC